MSDAPLRVRQVRSRGESTPDTGVARLWRSVLAKVAPVVFLSAATAIGLLAVSGSARQGAPVSGLQGAAGWGEDLRLLAAELPKLHKNAFHTVTRERFEAEVARCQEDLPKLSELEFRVRTAQIVAIVGDAHTSVRVDNPDNLLFPVHFAALEDGISIDRTTSEQAGLIGAKLVEIDGRSTEELHRAVGSLIPSENPYWSRLMTARMLNNASILHALRLTKEEGRAVFRVVMRDGSSASVTLEAVRPGPGVSPLDVVPWKSGELPMRLENGRSSYWLRVLDADKAVYFAYNACQNEPETPFLDLVDTAMEAIDAGRADRLIVDLRQNGGGNSNVAYPLISAIKSRPALNRKDKLFILIGPQTFSSAMMNAQQFRDRTQATLVGEPTGGKPNSYGEVKFLELPNSGIKVSYCVKYFKMLKDTDPDAVYPDISAPMSSTAFFAGADPALERIGIRGRMALGAPPWKRRG